MRSEVLSKDSILHVGVESSHVVVARGKEAHSFACFRIDLGRVALEINYTPLHLSTCALFSAMLHVVDVTLS
jgi:hypothetical protein